MVTSSLHINRDIILVSKQQALNARQQNTPVEAVLSLAQMQSRPRPILNYAVDKQEIVLIAQITRTPIYDPVTSALHCVEAGADAIALFTDHAIYEHDLDDLLLVSRGLPEIATIYQNYVLSEYAVIAARAAGASAVVVYASLLDDDRVRRIATMTQRWKMSTIVQVTDPASLTKALGLSPHVLAFGDHLSGRIRDTVDMVMDVRDQLPAYCRIMLMHPLQTLDDVVVALQADVNAVIVDQSLLQNSYQARRLKDLIRDMNAR